MMNILILGGTTEASALAQVLAERGLKVLFSYAGRVASLKSQPVPVRVGGFGGVDGLSAFLREGHFTHLIDATHPFAAQMSTHTVGAAQRTGIKLVALTRPPWQTGAGDQWWHVPDMARAVTALSGPSERIMLAIGRQHLGDFADQPQHHYLLRLVETPATPPPFPHYTTIVDRGPFTVDDDLALMRTHGVERVVCKNSGGQGAAAKLIAARQLGLPVLMVDRPALPARHEVHSIDAVLEWLGHTADLGV